MMSHAKRLSREAYTSNTWYSRETEELFASSWVFAGTLSDFAKTGDYRTVQAGAFALAIIKQKDDALLAVHNICRHRGAELFEPAAGNTGTSIVCPYHRWTYGLEGGLRGAPNMATCFPDLDRASLSLKPAALGVFRGLVFANPDPSADFDIWIEPLKALAWPHDLVAKDLREAVSLTYDMKCDWKIFVENAIDGYHLAYLHEKTLGGPLPDQNVWERAGDHMVWYATDAETRHRLPSKIRKEAKGVKMVKGTEAAGYGGVYFLFPTTLIVPTPYGFSVSSLIPTGAGRCRMDVRTWVGPGPSLDVRKYIPGYDKASGIISSDNWTQPPLETGDFQTEDVWICEKIQRGISSPGYEPGPLAEGAGAEDPIEWFHEMLSVALNLE